MNNVVEALGNTIVTLLGYYSWVLIAYILLSWFPNARESKFGQILSYLCEPFFKSVSSDHPSNRRDARYLPNRRLVRTSNGTSGSASDFRSVNERLRSLSAERASLYRASARLGAASRGQLLVQTDRFFRPA